MNRYAEGRMSAELVGQRNYNSGDFPEQEPDFSQLLALLGKADNVRVSSVCGFWRVFNSQIVNPANADDGHANDGIIVRVFHDQLGLVSGVPRSSMFLPVNRHAITMVPEYAV